MAATSITHGAGDWGIDNAETGLIIENISFSFQHEKADIFDQSGNTTGVTYFDEKVEVSIDAELPSSAAFSGTLGTELTLVNSIPALIRAGVSGGALLLEDIQVTHNRKDYKKASIKAMFYPNVTAS